MELRIGTGGPASQSSKCPNSRRSLKQAQNLKHASIESMESWRALPWLDIGGTSPVPPDSDDGNAARVDPRDGHEWRCGFCVPSSANACSFGARLNDLSKPQSRSRSNKNKGSFLFQ